MEFLKKQLEWIKGFLSEKDGKASSKRLLSTIIVVAFVVTYSKVALFNKELIDLPTNWLILLPTLIGINVWANKVANGK